ncbi:MAG: 30S ribosomal protein S9 [Sweet potato little leaf phytoplasma]|uniref:Small ribosomal subunit protein uS9 n=4 Tax=Candidatus Phytoplasma TaxID=33926 RepID=A0A9K3ST17_9MOLU|nr:MULTISPECIES: 30S ribosomal protein S9 [Phytoplasma]QLL36728.1 30S ribosomal protein S9 ['Echinacea purpurea' witches'-broom phytoplasma]WEX20216.1 MAG: 30S ribosomal protein S9 [Candidatus Phytoplasma aurantifolia]EMR14635.1 30S ribosomal protein S9 [Peanut witches'-broom phytoplasma NTU2011]MCG3566585.1 30S ribosomal protein S9 [Sesame phyllody phytoplasma]MDO7986950.1 30S ribosomal protein S9 [Sweet potato little leaf phytoplasma]
MTIIQFNGTGRRKTSVARTILRTGSGNIIINNRNFEEYISSPINRSEILKPLKLTNELNCYNIQVIVHGGGSTSQAEAIRLGISRALLRAKPSLRSILKKAGFLTRDARIVERKKPGYRKSRARPQFSKR